MRKRQRGNEKRPETGKTWVKKNSIFLCVGAALAAVLLSGYFLDNDSRDRARILRVEGGVLIERGQETFTPVAGEVLNPHDKIFTAAGSFLEITYDDTHKDVLRIGEDSAVVLESVVIEKQTNVFMYKGEIMLKLEKLEKGSTFRIRSPVAVAGVRGTSFAVRLKDNEALITDFESKIFVKGLTEDFLEMKDELLLSKGWKVSVAQFEKPSRVESITPEEFAAWREWLNEIDSLSKAATQEKSGLTRLASRGEAVSLPQSAFASGLMKKVNVSSSALAFLLYIALATNLGKVFLWQAALNKANI